MRVQDQAAQILGLAKIHRLDCAGTELLWQQWPAQNPGSTPPLMLLHGGFGSWNHWIRNVASLSQSRDVWTLDLPGLGRSGDLPKPYTTRHIAETIFAGLQALLPKNQDFEVAGFSFGAMIAAQLALMVGERCRRCTLIGAAGFGDLHVQVALLPPPVLAEDSSEPDAETHRITRENLRRLMLHKDEAVDDLAVYLHADNLARHRFRSRKLAGSNELAELLPNITVPLVGIWGAEDATAGGADNLEARHQLFAKAPSFTGFHVIPDAGHWVMYEASEAVNTLLSL